MKPNPSKMEFDTRLRDIAFARARLYGFMSDVFLNGLSETSYALASSIEELSDGLPQQGDQGEQGDQGDRLDIDQAAAEHFDLFQMQITPIESFFRDTSGMIGGPYRDAVWETYLEFGFQFVATDHSCDHIGEQLFVLSKLCHAEHQAVIRDTDAGIVFRGQQKKLIDRHLIHWMDPLVVAITEQSNRFYSNLATLMRESIQHHEAELAERETDSVDKFESQDVINSDEEETGGFENPEAWAEHLRIVARSGLYLSKNTIDTISRQLNLPHGFGGRSLLLQNLVHSAIKFDQLDPLMNLMIEHCESTESKYRRGRDKTDSKSGDTWIKRLKNTRRRLQQTRFLLPVVD